MNHIFVQNHHHGEALIVIFLGWGVPAEAFTDLKKNQCDILLLSGYGPGCAAEAERIIAGKQSAWNYKEIIVIGWSFGVKPASAFIADTPLNITLRIAVNGTEQHIHPTCGIRPEIFSGTLNGLHAATLRKFRLRTAGTRYNFEKNFSNAASDDATVERLRRELQYFASLPAERSNVSLWDKAVIGECDRIFPPEAQRNAWQGIDITEVADMPHLPDFQWIIDRFVIDKSKVCDKFAQAGDTYEENATIQKKVARRLLELSDGIIPQGNLDIIEMGYGHGVFTRMYLDRLASDIHSLTLVDLDTDPEVGKDTGACHVQADVEDVHFINEYLTPESKDVIFSSSMIQWLNSPATWLRRCAAALRSDGVLAVSFYSGDTFSEISSITGSGLQYPALQSLSDIARCCGMTINVATTECETLEFDTPRDALHHLQLTGVNGLSATASPATVRRLIREWPLTASGKARLTFCPAYLVLTKKPKA